MRLIVKGNSFEAARAAADRGIPFAFVRQVYSPGNITTVGHVGEQFRDKVVDWFGESAELKEGEGFPPGTLLLY